MNDTAKVRSDLIRRYPSLGLLKVIAREVLGEASFELPDGDVPLLEYADALVRLAEVTGHAKQLARSMSFSMGASQADLVILCPLPLELRAVLRRIGTRTESPDDGPLYYRGVISSGSKRNAVVATCLAEYGNLSVFDVAAKVVDAFRPKVLALLGIGGGIQRRKTDVLRGDLVIPDQILYYEVGKDRKPFRFVDRFYRTSMRLIQQIKAVEARNDIEDLIKGAIQETPPTKTSPRLRRHIAVGLASGEKVIDSRSSRIRKHVVQSAINVVGIDMESAGVAAFLSYQASHGHSVPELVVIRSVCDYADGSKDKAWQSYCAEVAAAYFFALIKMGISL
jgi:nucleoside phosphorylase